MSSHLYYSGYERKKKVVDDNAVVMINELLEKQVPEDTKKFLSSIQNFHIENNGLTDRQFKALKNIKELYEQSSLNVDQRWIKEYDDEKKKRARICALYYEANPPYFASLVNRILSEEDFIPTEEQYKAMCENKYAKKVIEATFLEPLYPVGAIVQGRKNAIEEIQNKYLTIIATNDRPVVSASKGAKTYLVLEFGRSVPVECEEKHLKKCKKDLTKK